MSRKKNSYGHKQNFIYAFTVKLYGVLKRMNALADTLYYLLALAFLCLCYNTHSLKLRCNWSCCGPVCVGQ